jgi:hypothetical protein
MFLAALMFVGLVKFRQSFIPDPDMGALAGLVSTLKHRIDRYRVADHAYQTAEGC